MPSLQLLSERGKITIKGNKHAKTTIKSTKQIIPKEENYFLPIYFHYCNS